MGPCFHLIPIRVHFHSVSIELRRNRIICGIFTAAAAGNRGDGLILPAPPGMSCHPVLPVDRFAGFFPAPASLAPPFTRLPKINFCRIMQS
jgi:hypothetical protein